MRIPHTQLTPATLRASVVEFVTRDGTDQTSVDWSVAEVLGQLDAGLEAMHFDAES